jgi:SagB-type dehydrogenase family enzyme
LERGLYHYQVQSHALAHLGPSPEDEQLRRLVYADGLWENAGGLIVLTALFERTQRKYGERGYRFVWLDAGHLAQNILLACEDLRLAAIPLGGFDDDGLAEAMDVEPLAEMPIYAILIGTE